MRKKEGIMEGRIEEGQFLNYFGGDSKINEIHENNLRQKKGMDILQKVLWMRNYRDDHVSDGIILSQKEFEKVITVFLEDAKVLLGDVVFEGFCREHNIDIK